MRVGGPRRRDHRRNRRERGGDGDGSSRRRPRVVGEKRAARGDGSRAGRHLGVFGEEMHRSERGDGGRVDAAERVPAADATTRRRRRRAPRVKREFRRLAAIEPRRRIRRPAERTPVEVHPVRRGEFEDGERRPGVPAASDVSKVPRDEFVRSGGETVRGHHVGAPREPIPARGRHRVAPGRGVDVPSHVRRARAVAVRGTSHDHRDERFAIGRLRGSRRRRVATPRVESRAPVEFVHAGGIRGVPEGRPHALVLEETERSVALADGVVRVVLGASRPLGSRAEDGQVVVLEAGDGDGEATERGAAGGVARGDEEEALVAGETQGGGDADVVVRVGVALDVSETAAPGTDDGGVERADVEARVHHLAVDVAREDGEHVNVRAVVVRGGELRRRRRRRPRREERQRRDAKGPRGRDAPGRSETRRHRLAPNASGRAEPLARP